VQLRQFIGLTLTACACASCTHRPDPRVPRGYPSSYSEEIDAAEREGELDILSATDQRKAAGLIALFRQRYPSIRVNYVEMSAREVDDTLRAQARAGHGTADLVWSAAMDLQMKLVNDGLTRRYVSPERRPHIARWDNWKNQAWATTAEPVVFVYNRKLLPDSEVPRDHPQLRAFLESHPAPGRLKLATYSVANSAVGYLYFSQDEQVSGDFWRFVRAMGTNGSDFYPDAESIVTAVASGRAALGYDVVGSYALDEIKRNPVLGMVVPRDYSLVLSRIAVLPAAARHPDAGMLFLDIMLSPKGQSALAAEDMPPIRDDVPGPSALKPQGTPLRAIRVGPSLLITQDRLTRIYFLRKWSTALASGVGARGQGANATDSMVTAARH